MRKLYRSSNVGVLALTDQTTDNSLLEMMAVGLPVVTTSVGGVPGYADGSAVSLSDLDNVDGIVGKFLLLSRNPEIGDQEGSANRAFTEQHYSIDTVCQVMEGVYRQVAS